MTTLTTKRSWFLARLRCWLVFQLMRRGIEIQVEARHGAFRTRHREIWKGGLVRVDIPLQKKHGVTDTPMGRISTQTGKLLIDAFTGVEGENPHKENRP